MIKIPGFLVFILCLPLWLPAQKVLIEGNAPGAEGKTIRLFVPGDLLTGLQKEVAHATVATDGHFELSVSLSSTSTATLAIGFHQADLYIEPGMGYEIGIAPMNYNGTDDISPLLESQDLALRFRETEKNELNYLVQQFNIRYDSFLLHNFQALYRDRQKARIDTFRLAVQREFRGMDNPYFEGYMKYRIATMEQLAKTEGQARFIGEYFSDPPVLYSNTAYMDLFSQVFTKYITVTSRTLKFKDYNTILKGPDSYAAMMKTLAGDTLLMKPRLREMVMMKGVMDLFYQAGYDQESILRLLETIAEKSDFPENRIIAQDLIEMLNHLRPGTPAPGFTLVGPDKKKVSLKDFRGKPVLLNFWTTWCQDCLREMEVMKDLYVKYGAVMDFVSISADREFLKMKYFLDLKKDFNWTFLHLGDDMELLKAYDVRSFPVFVLIDADGNIFRCPADMPSAGLEQSIRKLVNP
jgi:peroxiredoxin